MSSIINSSSISIIIIIIIIINISIIKRSRAVSAAGLQGKG